MKKILFFAATVTMLFAACTNEDLVAPQTGAETTLEDGAVGFDVYLPGATAQTRAGRAGVMTTGVLQQTGFGIYGYQTDNVGYSAGMVPGYMWNQQVNFNKGAAGWYYAPLKYWPNETKNDSQITPTQAAGMPDQDSKSSLDRLTFFAYAPWVKATNDAEKAAAAPINTNLEAGAAVGITQITNNAGVHKDIHAALIDNPAIKYVTATDPDYSVDLLWGVAPAGGLSYQNVSGGTTTVDEGMPLIDLVKPAVNTNIKFQFQHALARLGVKVVLAADQVAPGGKFDYGNTKVTIEKIEVKGNFGTAGYLDLNNKTTGKNVANWIAKNKADGSAPAALNPVLTIDKTHGLAPHLVYDADKNPASGTKSQQVVTGVTLNQADAIKVRSLYDAEYADNCATAETGTSEKKLKYSPTRPYFTSQAGIATTPTPTYATFNDFSKAANTTYLHKFVTNNGVAYTNITGTINTTYPNATVWEDIYKISTGSIREVGNGVTLAVAKEKKCEAYRKVGNTYTATGQPVQTGDYVFSDGVNKVNPTKELAPEHAGTYYKAMPNYFMVIPSQAMGLDTDEDKANRTLKVKITYYVSTTDENVANKVVYTKNEVEKDVVLPHLKNGVAYDLRLILGLTSVKVEADVADWVTTGAEVNLPQNISE